MPLIGVAGACGSLLDAGARAAHRAIVIAVALAALLAAPATWAAETLGHATNGTFPTGGPASASMAGRGGVGRRARVRRRRFRRRWSKAPVRRSDGGATARGGGGR